MPEPFSIAAATVGISSTTLHLLGKFLDDLNNIKSAPEVVAKLKKDIQSFYTILTSLKDITDKKWESLGNSLTNQAQDSIDACTGECTRLRNDLQRWTSRSQDGKLQWQDRVKVGFKRDRIKSMSQQLQNCKITIISMVATATFSSILNTHNAEEIQSEASKSKTEIIDGMKSTDEQLDELGTTMGQLSVVSNIQEDPETTEDREDARRQAEEAQKALHASQKLLGELLKKVQNDSGAKAAVTTVTFGHHNSNHGFQAGVVNGSISGLSFGVKSQ